MMRVLSRTRRQGFTSLDARATIRQVIHDNFNDPDTPFTNDQVLEVMIRDGYVDSSVTVDDLAEDFEGLCRSGLARDIAQNFTTIWLKLFDMVEPAECATCGVVHLGRQEDRVCPLCSGGL